MCLRPQGADWGCLEGYSLPHSSLELFSRELLGPTAVPRGYPLRPERQIPHYHLLLLGFLVAIVFCYKVVWKELRKGVNGLIYSQAQMDGGWRDLTVEEKFCRTIPALLDYAINIGKANRTQKALYASA